MQFFIDNSIEHFDDNLNFIISMLKDVTDSAIQNVIPDKR